MGYSRLAAITFANTCMDKQALRQTSVALTGKLSQPEEFVSGLHRLLETHADEKSFANYRRIIPEMRKTFGTPLPALRVIAAEIAKHGKKEPHIVLPLLKTLWEDGSFEERQIVGKVTERLAGQYPAECLALVLDLLPTLENWANCDNLACFGMKAIALQMTDEVLFLCNGWVRDENKWIRRFGVVVLRAFEKTDLQGQAIEIIDLVMTDRDSDVKKGVAWMLRDLSKRHPSRVFEFLLKWSQSNPGRDTTWIIKNGMKKLSVEQQQHIAGVLEV